MGMIHLIFFPKNELGKEFEVTASFYRVGEFECRNQALIKRVNNTEKNEPDAIIIMANPGSSRPLDPTDIPPLRKNYNNDLPYVTVKPDPTQFQLMRLMKLMDWNEISIINLSDLVSGNMIEFKKKLQETERFGFNEHTIFSNKRTAERKKFLNKKDSKVILAWGQNPIIQRLAEHALNKLPKNKEIFGLPSPNKSWGFRHPFPMLNEKCIEWLNDMYKQLLGK